MVDGLLGKMRKFWREMAVMLQNNVNLLNTTEL